MRLVFQKENTIDLGEISVFSTTENYYNRVDSLYSGAPDESGDDVLNNNYNSNFMASQDPGLEYGISFDILLGATIAIPAKTVTIFVPAKLLQRTHSISGKRSRKKVEAIAESLRTNKSVDPINVYNHKGKDYIIDGHHRAAAGRITGIDIGINRTNNLGHFESLDELLDSASSVGFDNLKGIK